MNRMLIFGIPSALLLLIGVVLLQRAQPLEPYTDIEAYEKEYASIAYGDSDAFHKLRETYLSPKYQLEDYGRTSIMCGIAILALLFVRSAPNKRWKVVAIGLIAAFATTAGTIYRLDLEMGRGSFPQWGDSLGIPVAGAIVVLFLFLVWIAANSIAGLNSRFNPGMSIKTFNIKRAPIFYLIFLVLTALILLDSAVAGEFEWIIPAFIWGYFYLSLLLGRQKSISAPGASA